MDILFENARIFDAGSASVQTGWVGVEQGTIVAVEKHNVPPPSQVENRLDLKHSFLMPGLIDTHLHLGLDSSANPVEFITSLNFAELALHMAAHAAATLSAGVTTVRDMGCRGHVDLALRQALLDGLIPGPRLLCAGQMICMTGGHGWQFGLEADGQDQVCQGVRRQLKAGVDVIKLMATGGVCTKGVEPGQAQLTQQEMAAGIQAAHLAGRKTAAHAQSLQGVKNAVAAGIDSIEHGDDLDEAAVEEMEKKEVFLVPTLAAGARMIAGGVASGLADYMVSKSKAHRAARLQGLSKAKAGGVKIVMGTDAGTPLNHHGSNARELFELVQAGFTAAEALQSATSLAAELLGLQHRLGRITPGFLADLLIVNGDPAADITVLGDRDRLLAIYQAGQLTGGLWSQTT